MTISPAPAPLALDDSDCRGVPALLVGLDFRDWGAKLHQAGQTAQAAGDAERGATLQLLARACALRLVPLEKLPFLDGWLPGVEQPLSFDGFTEDEVERLSMIAPTAAPPALRARLADLVWLRTRDRRRHFPMVAIAIEAYRTAPLAPESWYEDGRDAWTRALQLSTLTGGAIADEIEAALVEAFKNADDDDHYVPLHFLDPLMAARRKASIVDGAAIARRLQTLARMWQARHCYHQATAYHLAAQPWIAGAGSKADAQAALIELGLCYAAQGDAAGPGAAALTYIEKAIQTLRLVPAAARGPQGIDERIDTLRMKYRAAGRSAVESMTPLAVSSDIGALRKMGRARVSGLTARDALAALATVCPPASVGATRAGALETAGGGIFGGVFDDIHLGEDGRVIAKVARAGGDDADHEAALMGAMVEHFVLHMDLVVQGLIVPALQVVWREHGLQRADILQLVRQSALVPPGRVQLVARALFAGGVFDFVGALYLLVPQVEHIVRYHLREVGAQTSTLNGDGIDQENALGALVALDEMKQVFGADLAFEIRALFCHQRGPNLRNTAAHGLLDDDGSNAGASVYAWWLLLRLVVTPFVNGARTGEATDDAVGDPA